VNKGEGIIAIGARGDILRRAEFGPSFLTIAWVSNLVHDEECVMSMHRNGHDSFMSFLCEPE
jgi:hypothetical protein